MAKTTDKISRGKVKTVLYFLRTDKILYISGSVFCFIVCAFMSITLHCSEHFWKSVLQLPYNHTAYSLILLNASKNSFFAGGFKVWETDNIISGQKAI